LVTTDPAWLWPDSLDAVLAAPDHHTVIFENTFVRVLDTRISRGDTVPLHTHRWPGVLQIVSWSDVVRRNEHGTITLDTRSTPITPATTMWSPALPPHTLENVGTVDIHVVSIEIKNAHE
jgi:hypothetical protein